MVQTDSSINKEGIGLGLFISKGLVAALGGTISMKSKEGVGTTLKVTIPISQQIMSMTEPLISFDISTLIDYKAYAVKKITKFL